MYSIFQTRVNFAILNDKQFWRRPGPSSTLGDWGGRRSALQGWGQADWGSTHGEHQDLSSMQRNRWPWLANFVTFGVFSSVFSLFLSLCLSVSVSTSLFHSLTYKRTHEHVLNDLLLGGVTCRDCSGKGWVRCLHCHGNGWMADSGGHKERCFYCQHSRNGHGQQVGHLIDRRSDGQIGREKNRQIDWDRQIERKIGK